MTLEKLKNLIHHINEAVWKIAITMIAWTLTVLLWELLIEYPQITMGILAGIPAVILIYFAVKDEVNNYRRQK